MATSLHYYYEYNVLKYTNHIVSDFHAYSDKSFNPKFLDRQTQQKWVIYTHEVLGNIQEQEELNFR